MRRNRWPGLLLISLLSLSGCQNGPQVTVEISDPAAGGFQTFNQASGASGFLPYSQSEKHVCFPPADAQTLLNWCSQGVAP